MNKQRRKWLSDVITKLEEAKTDIESIAEEEREAYDNLPEGIQESDKGDAMYENADNLDQAASDLDDLISNLNEIIES